MKIQIYGYTNVPYASIPQVCAAWARVLKNDGHDVLVYDYSPVDDCRFEDIKKMIGEHDPPAPVGIYFGYPSYVKTTGVLVNKNKYRVGVFSTETGLSHTEQFHVKEARYTSVVVPSEYCKKEYSRCGREIQVVHHGIHNEFYMIAAPPPKRKNFTFLYMFNISATGGTVERKNYHGLLEAFALFRKKRDAQLLVKIPINHEIDPRTEEEANPGLEIDNSYYYPIDLVGLYSQCHVYVNPTRAEGYGMTVLEAQAAGIPVVSPIHSGLEEFLDENNCVVIPSKQGNDHFNYATNQGKLWNLDPKDTCDAMITAYDNYEKLEEDARARIPDILGNYSWNDCMKGFLGWLKTLNT